MEEQSYSISDFIRKKLQQPDLQSDGWDRPDPAIWNQVQGQIGAHSASSGLKATWIWIITTLMTGFMLLCIYLFLQNRNLYSRLDARQIQMEHMRRQTLSDQDMYAAARADWQKKHRQLEQIIDSLQLQPHSTTAQVALPITKGNPFAAHSAIVSKTIAPRASQVNADIVPQAVPGQSAQTQVIEKSRLPDNWPALSGRDFELLLTKKPYKKPHSLAPAPSLDRQPYRFGIGYEMTFNRLPLPTEKDFQDETIAITDQAITHTLSSMGHGIRMHYAPGPKWTLHGGLSRMVMSVEQRFQTGLVYDESKEYENQDGQIQNDLLLQHRTPYASGQQAIGIKVPLDFNLRSGDILILSLEEVQEITYYQIPIGIRYHLGGNRINWALSAGFQGNLMRFGAVDRSSKVVSKDRDLPIYRVWDVDQPAQTKLFVSAFGGIHMDYRLHPRWYFSSDLEYQYHLIKQELTDLSRKQLIARNIRLGLGYRF